MLQRAEEGGATVDCSESTIALACLDPELDAYKDCPAACRADDSKDSEKEDTKVRSGDLAVTAKAAEGKKVLQTGISDMDTLTFKTSEEVEINKITLERYGYNSDDSDKITGIWLEDLDGNIIAESKTLTKDKVTLSIKKDYRKVDGEYTAIIVIQTNNASKGTIGFKVTDVDSTAKNLNVDNYSPYTYEIIDYTGSAVTVDLRGSDKEYNYEEGNSYELARLKVKSSNTKDIVVKGFTLTNKLLTTDDARALDMKEFLNELTVTVDSKEIKAKATVNKNDELVITFNEDVEIAMNKSALFVVSATFKDFDAYGDGVRYYIASESDFNAIEKKNGTRVTFDRTDGHSTAFTNAEGAFHKFAGGKIKLSNKKLGNVDAAQASEGTVVAEGDVTITEPLSKISFNIDADGNASYIETFTMVVNGDEFEATKVKLSDATAWAKTKAYKAGDMVKKTAGDPAVTTYYIAKNDIAENTEWAGANWTVVTDADFVRFNFKNVDIEKSGKIQFKVDIKDVAVDGNKSINFKSSFGKASFDGAKYDSTNKYVSISDVAGTISFSKVNLQKAKASLENKLTKDVEFVKNETNRKVVFDGTYTAKKADVDLNKFTIVAPNANGAANPYNGQKITFYLSIDGEEVADTDPATFVTQDDDTSKDESFSDVRVKAGESVKVKVEAEVEAYGDYEGNLPAYRLVLRGTDVNGNEDTGNGADALTSMKIKAKGSVTIPSTKEDKTALLRASNSSIAKFTVKPSNNNEGITLEDLILDLAGTAKKYDAVAGTWTANIDESDLRVKVGGVEYDLETVKDKTGTEVPGYSINEEIPTSGIDVEILLKPEVMGTANLTVVEVNGKSIGNEYSKYFVPSLVTFMKQDEGTTSTEYTVKVEHADDAYSITSFTMFNTCTGANGAPADWTVTSGETVAKYLSSLSDEETFTIMRGTTAQEICAVQYVIAGEGLADNLKTVQITKQAYKDYFRAKEGGKELAIPKA